MKIAKMPNGTPEIYAAVQGEGPTMGKPCIFVRLALCNLHCVWCDTSYTWNFKGTKFKHRSAKKVDPKDYMKQMTVEEIVIAIKKAAGRNIRRVVFSGGEPTLQQKEIIEVIDKLKGGIDSVNYIPWKVEVETNGTIPLLFAFVNRLDNINCSPKLASSGNGKELRDKPDVIKGMFEHQKNHYRGIQIAFKFVIVARKLQQDLKEVKAWQKKNDVESNLIYLMPEGITRDKIQRGVITLNDIGQRDGYNVSPRLHILTYGSKRAV